MKLSWQEQPSCLYGNHPIIQVYLSLGGNQAQTRPLLEQAIYQLSQFSDEGTLFVSPFYHTSPVEAKEQDFFINCACTFQTTLLPKALLRKTQQIERELGKVPKPKWESRPIDIDIIFYGTHIYRDEELEIPHPRWKERLFVLIPLADLTPRIHLKRGRQEEWCDLKKIIHDLLRDSRQMVSPLEKKAHLH